MRARGSRPRSAPALAGVHRGPQRPCSRANPQIFRSLIATTDMKRFSESLPELAGSLGNVHHERACAMQRHTLSVARIQSVQPTNLPIFNRDNRYEAVFESLPEIGREFGKCSPRARLRHATPYSLRSPHTERLGNVHHERACAMQRHTLSVARIQSHEGFTAHDLCWIARKSIPKLERRIGAVVSK